MAAEYLHMATSKSKKSTSASASSKSNKSRSGGKTAPTPEADIDDQASAELCRVVGERVRERRLALDETMAVFAEKAGISLGMLSKIEHGQTAPSLSTLTRLAGAAAVPVTALFRGLDEEHDIVIVKAGEGHEIAHEGSGPGRKYEDLGSLRGPRRIIEPMMTTLDKTDDVFPLYQHEGVEFIYMLEGSLEYGYGNAHYRLDVGDTMQLHGEVTHGPTEILTDVVRFLSIKVYPAPTTDN